MGKIYIPPNCIAQPWYFSQLSLRPLNLKPGTPCYRTSQINAISMRFHILFFFIYMSLRGGCVANTAINYTKVVATNAAACIPPTIIASTVIISHYYHHHHLRQPLLVHCRTKASLNVLYLYLFGVSVLHPSPAKVLISYLHLVTCRPWLLQTLRCHSVALVVQLL